mmetsp:Transcript_20635/g.25020  ORF Transcript_20635/g.25020 Transcript_20635/m.25020 type:complete len:272 (+) Transcript_20635:59-874(+)|eukprot:CAMPEP_0204822024 /NCGR_PEP_ID=MMETSP1346-20131115/210_1 /ASSEMBLY_ACC=CAM_ASM_000771 /TAXON_ID=215587 /ORGANISM="Aplanochytrium stocchinoi, Strain GSBS06" /LENGTH=271 /DNA_ID=CAMNT_0051948025 /DNA_START=192 /DNA_END=1007 /DNA_ORIENTATION=-
MFSPEEVWCNTNGWSQGDEDDVEAGIDDDEEEILLLKPSEVVVESEAVSAQNASTLHEEFSKSVRISNASSGDIKSIVLVLDLNGLLVHRVRVSHKNKGSDKRDKGVRVGRSIMYIRPYTQEFLELIFNHFDIVIWSSARVDNIQAIIDVVLNKKQRDSVKAVLDQSHCKWAGPHPNEPQKPLFLKELSRVWEVVGTPSNTLLVDDSPEKADLNPPYTAVHPKPWCRENQHDTSLRKGGPLYAFFEKLAKHRDTAACVDVPSYIKTNPYFD